MTNDIVITGMSATVDGHRILRDIDLRIKAGSIVCIIGPSGAGKSTLLRCLNGLVPVDVGSIDYGDYCITSGEQSDATLLRRNIAMVFQQFNLWPHRTVLQNVTDAPIIVMGQDRSEAEKEAHALLRRIGLEGYADAYPSALSGGQQQRVAIVRALAMQPTALLLDEVTSSLDPELKREVLAAIRDVALEKKRTIVMATHEIGFARNIADEMVFMDQGRIVERGATAKLLAHPSHERTRRFLAALLEE